MTTATQETPNFGREFTEARRTQGFRSQDHLDAFYRAYDHSQGCAACQKASGAWLDDGWQPAMGPCEIRAQLDRDSFSYLTNR